MTGLKKISKILFPILLIIGLVASARCVYLCLPPYSVGQCLVIPGIDAQIQVMENYIGRGASKVRVSSQGDHKDIVFTFGEMRSPQLRESECFQ